MCIDYTVQLRLSRIARVRYSGQLQSPRPQLITAPCSISHILYSKANDIVQIQLLRICPDTNEKQSFVLFSFLFFSSIDFRLCHLTPFICCPTCCAKLFFFLFLFFKHKLMCNLFFSSSSSTSSCRQTQHQSNCCSSLFIFPISVLCVLYSPYMKTLGALCNADLCTLNITAALPFSRFFAYFSGFAKLNNNFRYIADQSPIKKRPPPPRKQIEEQMKKKRASQAHRTNEIIKKKPRGL